MKKQRLSGTGRPERRRWFVRVLREAGECEHRALVGLGGQAGRCLECGTCVPTPFTVHRSEWLPAA
jgi:hypothetical protein